eukprot:scaffold53198_cov27-Prasinocladus_malaysianus.AAC.5
MVDESSAGGSKSTGGEPVGESPAAAGEPKEISHQETAGDEAAAGKGVSRASSRSNGEDTSAKQPVKRSKPNPDREAMGSCSVGEPKAGADGGGGAMRGSTGVGTAGCRQSDARLAEGAGYPEEAGGVDD